MEEQYQFSDQVQARQIPCTLLYGCATWTLLVDPERRIQAFEMECIRRLPRISYLECKTIELVRDRAKSNGGLQEPLLTTVKSRKLQWFEHIRRHDSLTKTILQGTVRGWRRRGTQRKSRSDNLKEWTSPMMPELLAHFVESQP